MISLIPKPIKRRPADGGEALYFKWRNLVFSNRNWVKLYLFSFMGFIYALGLLIWAASTDDLSFNTGFEIIFILGSYALFLAIRVQLCSLPAMLIMSDFNQGKLDSIRVTSITDTEIFEAILKYWWSIISFPFTALLILECLMLACAYDKSELIISFNLFGTCLILCNSICLSFNLTALGYIAGIIFRRPIAPILGVLSPVAGLILTGLLLFLVGYWYKMYGSPVTYLMDFLLFLTVPEVFMAPVLVGDAIDGPSGEINYFWFVFIPLATSLLFGSILQIVIARRRN